MENILSSIIEAKIVESDYLAVQRLHHETLSKAAAALESMESSNAVTNNEQGSVLLYRIQTAKAAFDWSRIRENFLPYMMDFKKSAELSKKLREKGNELYKQRNGTGAHRVYTLSIAFAPAPSSEELYLAYANRSAVLMQNLNNPEEAICDIHRALSDSANLPPALKTALEEREEKCKALLQKSVLAEINGSSREKLSLFQIQDANPSIPNAESFVKIDQSPDKGRHLVVTNDVQAGTVLLVDRPFVSVLNNLLNWETDYCLNCSKWISNGIPCIHCTFGLFCSEKCRDEASGANGKHCFEHNYLPILRILNASHGDLQTLRILSIVGRPQLYKMWKNHELESSSKTTVSPGFNDSGVYDVTSYLPIFHLLSHEPKQDEETLCKSKYMNALKALFLKQLLKEYSNFLNDNPTTPGCSNDEKEFEDFIASLILKHLESIKYNAISLSRLSRDNQKSEAYAAAVYPVISLCNHSCDPNCVPVRDPNHLVTSLVALKFLPAGQELTITYKPLYTHVKTKDRQNFLAENYRFVCKCAACEHGWDPSMFVGDNATVILEPSRCPSCKDMGGSDENNGGNRRQCHECVKRDVSRAKELREMEQVLFECHDLMMKQQEYTQCLRRLQEVLNYFGKNGYSSHFQLYHVAIDLFKRALVFNVQRGI